MVQVFRRPITAVQLTVEPQLASWDATGSASQARLARYLTHIDAVAAPMMAGASGPLAVELTVGLARGVSPITGGRDLDNYLYPLAKHLGASQLAAVFGRKIHGASWLAIAPAQPDTPAVPPHFATRMTGSSEERRWKQALHDRLLQAQPHPLGPGPVGMDIALTTGSARNWANLWKPLIDSLGPLLGEDPRRPFNPADERIISLGLHHTVDNTIGHDVVIEMWWASLRHD